MVSFSLRYVKRIGIIFTKHSLKNQFSTPIYTVPPAAAYDNIRETLRKDTERMMDLICHVLLSVFFVYGVYSAMNQTKLLLRRLARRISAIDKKDS